MEEISKTVILVQKRVKHLMYQQIPKFHFWDLLSSQSDPNRSKVPTTQCDLFIVLSCFKTISIAYQGSTGPILGFQKISDFPKIVHFGSVRYLRNFFSRKATLIPRWIFQICFKSVWTTRKTKWEVVHIAPFYFITVSLPPAVKKQVNFSEFLFWALKRSKSCQR